MEQPKFEQLKSESEIETEKIERKPAWRKDQERIGQLNIGVGDRIVSKSGTMRTVASFILDKKAPGGGYFKFWRTPLGGKTEEEKLSFRQFLKALDEGAIDHIEHIEEESEENFEK